MRLPYFFLAMVFRELTKVGQNIKADNRWTKRLGWAPVRGRAISRAELFWRSDGGKTSFGVLSDCVHPICLEEYTRQMRALFSFALRG